MNRSPVFGTIAIICLTTLTCARAQAGWIILCDDNTVTSAGLPDDLTRKLSDLAAQKAALKSVSFCPSGGWVVMYNRHSYVSSKIPKKATDQLDELAARDADLKCITFTPWWENQGWIILHDKNGHAEGDYPPPFVKTVDDLAHQNSELHAVALMRTGSQIVLFNKSGYSSDDPEITATLQDLADSNAQLRCIAFTDWNGLAIVHDAGHFSSNIPTDAAQALDALTQQGKKIRSIAFRPDDIRLSQDDPQTHQKILDLMARYNVPGLSIALIDKGKLAWSRGYGVVTSGGQPVTTDTRFQAASISKPVTAVAALRLVQQHKLALDEDFNHFLKSWQIPKSASATNAGCTLRQILSHSAGFTVHGFPGYRANAKIPTLVQILQGKRPANTAPILINAAPGKAYEYSGGGYCVLQQAMLDVTGKSYPQMMDDLVLKPLSMTNSTYAQPLPQELRSVAAIGHDKKGRPIDGNYRTYPEMAPAGLWTTPSDLARFAIALQQAHEKPEGAILNPEMLHQMLTQQISTSRPGEGWGLGVSLSGSGKSLVFGHGGRNAGFDSDLVAFAHTGQGAVIMINANETGGLLSELMNDLRNEYAWPD
jgi:CubicO group peptidase (beta-lactamase class C family)